MRIAILHSGDLKDVSPGGISQYIEKIIKYNKDNDIVLFGTCDNKEKLLLGKEYDLYIDNSKFTFIPISNNKKRPLSIFYFINIFRYFNKLNEFDIVYAQRMEYAIPFTFSKIKNKLIMAIHGSGKYSYLYWGKFIGIIYNMIERLAIRNSKRVIVLLKREEYGLPYYKNKFTNQQKKFIYGKVPIDLSVFKELDKIKIRKELDINLNDKIIIYFGRLDNNPKRIMLLPEIINKLSHKYKDIKCIVIGNGDDKERLISKIKYLNLEEKFIIKNKLSHGEELVKYINIADISLILSTFEGICMSALESLACGVPVVATDVGDIKEYITNERNGRVIPNSNDEEVINLVCNYLNEFFDKKDVQLDNIFEEYDGKNVILELNNIFNNIE